jgi:hypothetical protein
MKMTLPSHSEAVEMLRCGIGAEVAVSLAEDHEQCVSLVEELGCYPLAIRQAAGYIRQTKVPVASYLDAYNAPQQRQFLQQHTDGLEGNVATVSRTFQVSLQGLFKYSQPEVPLTCLFVCAYVEGSRIPAFLIEEGTSKVLANQPAAMMDFPEVYSLLTGLNLLELSETLTIPPISGPVQLFSMHRVVQTVLRAAHSEWPFPELANPRNNDWARDVITAMVALHSKLQSQRNDYWLLPHLETVCSGR